MTSRRRARVGTWVAPLLTVAVLVSGCARSAPPAPGPTAVPTATPTLSPDEAAAAVALASFGALKERDDLAYHLSQQATMRFNGEPAGDVSDDIDVAGLDFAGTMAVAGETVRLVYVDGVTWAKVGKDAWKKGAAVSSEAAADVLDTWRYLGRIEDLVFAGRNHSDPARLDFENSRPVTYQTAAMKDQGMRAVIDKLTLTLATDGTPVTLRFHAIGSFVSGAMAERKVAIETVIDISRFGEAITVKPPK
jgi:hypothetical protein